MSESLARRFGGTAAACAQLSNHLAACGVRIAVATFDGEPTAEPHWPLRPDVMRKTCMPVGPKRLGWSTRWMAIMDGDSKPDLVHLHGLWRLSYVQAARSATQLGIPVILSVNGMLHERALEQHARLKQVARWLYQDRLVSQARCLHATAEEEAGQIKRLGIGGPIAVIPWGVEMPQPSAPAARLPGGLPRVLLYLGRLHPSKGLEMLIKVWARVSTHADSWRLVIAGHDEGGYGRALMRLASELNVADSIVLAGPVEGHVREQLFASARLLVLPSPAENFGFVVAEALVRGVPVIATRGAPWSSLVSEGCGWWVPCNPDAMSAVLIEALKRSPEDLRAMGERGRRFARERFAWPRAAAAMLELYTWVLGQGPEPAFVLH